MKHDNIWAPWRSEYVGGEKVDGCVFCNAIEGDDDEKNLILLRGEKVVAMMNRYPYTTAHLMIIPNRHVGNIEELTPEEFSGMWSLLIRAKEAIDGVYSPDGYNVGFNLGEAAGAGIAEHIHLHVVPRWQGDTNFMTALADVRVQPLHMMKTYAALKERLDP